MDSRLEKAGKALWVCLCVCVCVNRTKMKSPRGFDTAHLNSSCCYNETWPGSRYCSAEWSFQMNLGQPNGQLKHLLFTIGHKVVANIIREDIDNNFLWICSQLWFIDMIFPIIFWMVPFHAVIKGSLKSICKQKYVSFPHFCTFYQRMYNNDFLFNLHANTVSSW